TLITNANTYVNKHKGEPKAAAKVKAMQDVIAAAQREKQLLQAVSQDMQPANRNPGDIVYFAQQKGLSLRETVEFKRLDIDPRKNTNLDELREDKIDP